MCENVYWDFDNSLEGFRLLIFFFFSSRRRHTRSLCDWSSDVCSSDLYDADYIARLRIDIFCKTEQVDQIIDAIVSAGRTGEVGDGKIVVMDLEHVVRIRTYEIGAEAI